MQLEVESCNESIKNRTDTRDFEALERNWMLTDYNGKEAGKRLVSWKCQVGELVKTGIAKGQSEGNHPGEWVGESRHGRIRGCC